MSATLAIVVVIILISFCFLAAFVSQQIQINRLYNDMAEVHAAALKLYSVRTAHPFRVEDEIAAEKKLDAAVVNLLSKQG